jgi:hypothetical protein
MLFSREDHGAHSMSRLFEVKLISKGGTEIKITLTAPSQTDAKRLAEHQYPGYRNQASKPISS